MTAKQARHLTIGDPVTYKKVVRGTVTGLKVNSTFIQWADMPHALEILHDQMQDIELVKEPAQKGRYDR